MALFDPGFLTKLRYAALASQRSGGGLLAPGPVKRQAVGTELAGHRDYSPGDDYRAVDWNICARHDELVTRQFVGEADRHVYLLLDRSASMGLGEPVKFDVARRAAAALGYAALARLDRVAAFTFSDKLLSTSRPIRGKSRMGRLTRFLEGIARPEGRTNLARAAGELVRRDQRPGPAVVLSDGYDPGGFQAGLDVLRRAGYQPRLVEIHDPAEARPGVLGDCELFDVESEATWQVTLTKRHVRRYREAFDAHRESLRRYCAAYGIPQAEVATNLPLGELLARAVGAKRGWRERPAP